MTVSFAIKGNWWRCLGGWPKYRPFVCESAFGSYETRCAISQVDRSLLGCWTVRTKYIGWVFSLLCCLIRIHRVRLQSRRKYPSLLSLPLQFLVRYYVEEVFGVTGGFFDFGEDDRMSEDVDVPSRTDLDVRRFVGQGGERPEFFVAHPFKLLQNSGITSQRVQKTTEVVL